MADDANRNVTVERISNGHYVVHNVRGGKIPVGTGDGPEFTPVELLLASIGGCSAIDVDILTARRAEPESFAVRVDANKLRDNTGNRLTDITMTFRLRFPAGEAGDAARELLPTAIQRSHDRLCTVGRTVEAGTPIATRIDTPAAS
jgi:putative redox protein